MMKLVKKINNIFLIFVLLFITFIAVPTKTEGKTLRDLKEEY